MPTEETNSAQSESKTTASSLISNIVEDATAIVYGTRDLAKAELKDSVKNAGISIGLFTLALGISWVALILLFVAGAFGLVAAGLPEWAAFLSVAAGMLLVSVLFVLIGKSRAKKIGIPTRTIESIQQSIDTLVALLPTKK